MLHQPAANQLQQQTNYGLTRSSSSSKQGDFRGSRKNSHRSSTQTDNPFALRARDVNVSIDRAPVEGASGKKPHFGSKKSAKKSPNSNKKRQAATQGGKLTIKSPATTSVQSSGAKTPCISALPQSQPPMLTVPPQETATLSTDRSAQNCAQRYMNKDFIAEEEHDGSSYLLQGDEMSAQGPHMAIDEVTDDGKSQLSQSVIGAHLVKGNKDLFPMCGVEDFQTPMREDYETNPDASPSPIHSSRLNSTHSRQPPQMMLGQLNRYDMLQMSHSTTVTNQHAKVGVGIPYEHTLCASPGKPLHTFYSQTTLDQEKPGPTTSIEYCSAQLPAYKKSSERAVREADQSVQQDISSFRNSKLESSVKKSIKRNNSNKSGSKPRYDLSSSAIELSGLALNARKQTSPAQNENGRLVVTVQPAEGECSYDHQNGTKLIEESPGPSSPSLLNPYMRSVELSSKRFSSSIGRNRGMSPANIKLEPVKVNTASSFQEQQSIQIPPNKTISPDRDENQFTLQPIKAEESPAKQIMAQKIFSQIQEATCEGTEVYEDPLQATSAFQSVQTAPQHMTSTEQPVTRPKSASTSQKQTTGRRRRDQRKTPNGRNTVNDFIKRERQREEEVKQVSRAKFSDKRRETNNVSTSTFEQPVVSAKQLNGDEHERQRSTSSNHRLSQVGLKRIITGTSQGDAIRLANLERARSYGNKASINNKHNNSRTSVSPAKSRHAKGRQESKSPAKQRLSPVKAQNSPLKDGYSPLKQEVIHVCDIEIGFEVSRNATQPFASRSHDTGRSKHSASSPISSHNPSLKRKRREVKMSKPVLQAKLDFMQKHFSARKIQRAFRCYVTRQLQIERELEEARAAEELARFNAMVASAGVVQRAWRASVCRQGVAEARTRRLRLRMIVTDLVTAWKTRRSLNCLGQEVQEFVNCEHSGKRATLRNHFHVLFKRVMRNKLYLEDNFERLQQMKVQVANEMAQKKGKGMKRYQAPIHNQRAAANLRTQQSSPYKRNFSPEKQDSPRKQLPLTKRASPEKRQSPFKQDASTVRSSVTQSQPRKTSRMKANHAVRQSTGSINSRGEEGLNAGILRSSIDNQAIYELKNFIQNSDKKNESFCSIHVTNALNEKRAGAGMVDTSANGANVQSQVIIQVHNQSVPDMVSPQENDASDAKPVNILLGSCTRFSKEIGSDVKMNEVQIPFQVNEESPVEAAEPLGAVSSSQGKDKRKASNESTKEYRQNLRRVRPRVDCWNKSVTRADTSAQNESCPATSVEQMANINLLSASAYPAESHRESRNMPNTSAVKRSEPAAHLSESVLRQRRIDTSGIKQTTPVHGRNGTTGVIQPAMTMSRQGTQEGLKSALNAVAPALMKAHGSSHKAMGTQKLQTNGEPYAESNVKKSFDSSSRDLRSRSSTNLGASTKRQAQAVNQQNASTHLREPTKFSGQKNNGHATHTPNRQPMVDVKKVGTAPMIPGTPANAKQMNAPVSSRLAQLARPKSSQQAQSNYAARQNAMNTTRRGAELRQDLQRRPTTAKPRETLQTQLFTMRETITTLTAVMEQVAQDAETNQKQALRDSSQSRAGGYGLNSQHRAALKSIQNAEKQFRTLMKTLQNQFESFKELATPQAPQSEDQ